MRVCRPRWFDHRGNWDGRAEHVPRTERGDDNRLYNFRSKGQIMNDDTKEFLEACGQISVQDLVSGVQNEVSSNHALDALTGTTEVVDEYTEVDPTEWFPATLIFKVRNQDSVIGRLRDDTRVRIPNTLLKNVKPVRDLECYVRMKYKPTHVGKMRIQYLAHEFKLAR
jgi:hypothetical protein